MVRFASNVIVSTNSSKSRELDDLASAQDMVPLPLVWRNWLEAPSAPGQVYVTPLNVVAPEMEAVPTSSKLVSGELVLMPTLLLRVSTLRTSVSTVKFDDRMREDKVLLPDTVRVSETSLFELRVKGPMPMVLVGGSWRMVGTCLEKESKLDVRVLTLWVRASRSMMRASRGKEEAWADGMKLLIILVSIFWI